ncbi:hypothetical protein RUM44_011235 [Polyplax serrata]|uniref:Uncharacterized protein n=1 Tax=Polyplax serrata TaxID=468196 RepID=A0ABR1APK7_POLSC
MKYTQENYSSVLTPDYSFVLVFSSPELECTEAISQGFSPLKEQTVAESQVEILLDLQVTHADLIDVARH